MLSSFRASPSHRSESKRRRKTSGKSAARRGVFRALGWEQLERRELLTAAATITWTGGSAASANWSDPANWDLGRAPVNGDSLVFPGSAQQLANNDDIPGLSVNSITFDGIFGPGRYAISGDDLTLGAGGITDTGIPNNIILGEVNQINLNLNLSAAQTWSISDTGNNHDHELTVKGNVNNAGFTLTTTGQDLIDVAGQVSGSGGLNVESGPTVELDNTNTYTGATEVDGGTLIVDGSTADASAVTVGPGGVLGGTGTVGGAITVLTELGLPGPQGVARSYGGTLSPGTGPDPSTNTGVLSNTGGVAFKTIAFETPESAGSVGPGAFDVQLGGTAANPTNDQLDSTGTVSLDSATLDLSALDGAGLFTPGQQFVIIQAGAPISGTFSGLPEGSTVSDGTQEFTISYANDRVTLTTLAAATSGVITWTGAVDGNWSVPGNWDLDRAPVNGDSLVFPATAQHLASTNDVGPLRVNSITFQGTFSTGFGGYTLIGDDLTVGAGGIIDNSSESGSSSYYIYNYIDINLALGANQSWSNSGSPSFPLVIVGDVANDGFTLTATGTGIIDVDGPISGSGGVTVSGDTLDLQGANSYTGMTYVYGGALVVDGSTAAGSGVYVGPGSTLGGAGTIGGTVTVTGGDLSPGAGPDPSVDTGTLTVSGDVTLSGFYPPFGEGAARQAMFDVQFGGTAAAPTSDQLDSAASVSLSGAVLNLTTLSGAGPFNAGQQFVIVQAGAPITGTFLGLPEGSTVSDGTQNFTISYANDRITLTAQPLAQGSATYLNGQPGDGTAATFVHNLYRELLGREPDAVGQAYWVTLYNQLLATGSRAPGSPTPQQTLVADFLGSEEYRAHLVGGMYTNFLHRAADANGLAFWTNAMANGVDEKSVLAGILGSDEYFNDAQPQGLMIATNPTMQAEAWVSALYRDLLGRTADSGGLAFWTQQALASSHSAVAYQFLTAPEVDEKLLNGNYPGPAGSVGAPGSPASGAYALAEITGNGWDNLYFQGSLSADVIDSLFTQLQGGESYSETIAEMLDMPQYFMGG